MPSPSLVEPSPEPSQGAAERRIGRTLRLPDVLDQDRFGLVALKIIGEPYFACSASVEANCATRNLVEANGENKLDGNRR